MKIEPLPDTEDGEVPEGASIIDWKATCEDALKEVDKQLDAFGLEVMMYETDGDYYCWRVVFRVA